MRNCYLCGDEGTCLACVEERREKILRVVLGFVLLALDLFNGYVVAAWRP